MHLFPCMRMAACADRCASKPQVRHEHKYGMMEGQRINRSHMSAMRIDSTGHVAFNGVDWLTSLQTAVAARHATMPRACAHEVEPPQPAGQQRLLSVPGIVSSGDCQPHDAGCGCSRAAACHGAVKLMCVLLQGRSQAQPQCCISPMRGSNTVAGHGSMHHVNTCASLLGTSPKHASRHRQHWRQLAH